ncbi:MAG: addiction module protein [Burkholderiales bacterium]
MNTQLLQQASMLDIDEQIDLVEAIGNGFVSRGAAPSLTAAQKTELDRCLADPLSNPDDIVPWSEVKAARRLALKLFVSLCLPFISANIWAATIWTQTSLSNLFIETLAIDPITPTTLYAGGSFADIFKSTDGGLTWSLSNVGVPKNPQAQLESSIVILAINPATPSTLYAGTYGEGIFKSTDSGATWSTNKANYFRALSLAFDPATPTTLYAGAESGIFKSTDGGSTWKTVYGTDSVHALAIDPTSPTTLYAGTNTGVFKSTDAGSTWSTANKGVTSGTQVKALALTPQNPATLYIGTFSTGVFQSTDDGSTAVSPMTVKTDRGISTGLHNLTLSASFAPSSADFGKVGYVWVALNYKGTWFTYSPLTPANLGWSAFAAPPPPPGKATSP